MANSAEAMHLSVERALPAVQDGLGSGGAMYPENVPVAASVLKEYTDTFEKLETPATAGVNEVKALASELET